MSYPITEVVQTLQQIDYGGKRANVVCADLMKRHGVNPADYTHPAQISGGLRATVGKLLQAGDTQAIQLMAQAGYGALLQSMGITPPATTTAPTPTAPPVTPTTPQFTPGQPIMQVLQQDAAEHEEQELVEEPIDPDEIGIEPLLGAGASSSAPQKPLVAEPDRPDGFRTGRKATAP